MVAFAWVYLGAITRSAAYHADAAAPAEPADTSPDIFMDTAGQYLLAIVTAVLRAACVPYACCLLLTSDGLLIIYGAILPWPRLVGISLWGCRACMANNFRFCNSGSL